MTYLDRIVTAHRNHAERDGRDETQLLREAEKCLPPRGFRRAISRVREMGDIAVIAEVKRRSPSKGILDGNLDPRELAATYESGGAACLSVLTDYEFFGGSAQDLGDARDACHLPVLRKDFTVCRVDVLDARLMGADAILLIVAALDDVELRDFYDLARSVDLDVLVEVHDELELERALTLGADMIGVNQRDLITFEVDTGRAVRMAPQIPDDVIKVAESGIRCGSDAAVLAEAGFDALLVGESLVTSGDPAKALMAIRAGR